MKKKKIYIIFIVLIILNIIIMQNNVKIKRELKAVENEYNQFIENVSKTKELKENFNIKESILLTELTNFIFEEYVNKGLEETGIKKRVLYFKPIKTNNNEEYEETEYEIKIEDIRIKELVRFLYKIENEKKIIKVSSLKMNKSIKLKNQFDVIINLKYLKKNN
ncbi:MAG TPA: hypothetical protein PLD27_08525 [bacterium]|nr:hypothetical protein [bacterium]HOL48743.1 hypothetical protein [bacterium]HPQ19257.1 hypothetical protein [bacterium]